MRLPRLTVGELMTRVATLAIVVILLARTMTGGPGIWVLDRFDDVQARREWTAYYAKGEQIALARGDQALAAEWASVKRRYARSVWRPWEPLPGGFPDRRTATQALFPVSPFNAMDPNAPAPPQTLEAK